MKAVTVIGTRPQFIKASVVSRELKKNKKIREIMVHTGQHFDKNMSDTFFDQLQLPKPDYRLNINSLSHGAMTGRMMQEIETILMREKPDIVIVYGDTNSTLAGALAAKKLHISVAHIESGLRSNDSRMPEEINRILTDRVSDILFCPTPRSIANLTDEGFYNFNCKVVLCGDVMREVSDLYSKFAIKPECITLKEDFILCTIHREENTKNIDKLKCIVNALNTLTKTTKIVMPVHPNTKKILKTNNIKIDFELIDPVNYFEMVYLLKNCRFVITDSGGLQKESFFYNKKCLVLRDTTEWTELVEIKSSFLVGSDYDSILSHAASINSSSAYNNHKVFAEQKISSQIVETLISYLENKYEGL